MAVRANALNRNVAVHFSVMHLEEATSLVELRVTDPLVRISLVFAGTYEMGNTLLIKLKNLHVDVLLVGRQGDLCAWPIEVDTALKLLVVETGKLQIVDSIKKVDVHPEEIVSSFTEIQRM